MRAQFVNDYSREFPGFCNWWMNMRLLKGGTAARTEYANTADDETKFGS